MRFFRFMILAAVLAMAAPAAAQVVRMLPANGQPGELNGPQPYPMVQIGRKILRMAPGGVIIDQNNRFILHGYLPESAPVLYVLDPNGDISRLILLTPQEEARLEQARTQ